MAEIRIIAAPAAVSKIVDAGLHLSIKLYTFGEIVASADRSVISISKDVSLTSGILKELGQILEKDRKSRTISENALQTADGVVKECVEVFQEINSILVKKLPSLGAERKGEKRGERPNRAIIMLEKLEWEYLQPKLQLLRSNLDRLRSTLLLILNVTTYAKQVSEKTVSPSVIAEQRFLIEDLAHSNQEYIRNFENLRLGNRGDVEGFGDLPTTRRSVQSVFSANDPLFRFDTHRDDSFAGSSDKWPSADISSSKFNDCTKEAPTFGERGAKAKGSAKNTTNSIGQSTDAPIVGYVKPHQKDSSREKGADVPFQPRTSAASVDFYSGFDSLEAGVDGSYSLPPNIDLSDMDLRDMDILDNFDFEQYMADGDHDFDVGRFLGDESMDTFEGESKQDVLQSADTELVDHLVSLWTTLKL